jgi:hypothetical protein
MKILKLIFISLLLISFFSCKKTDDTPPVITMKLPDSVNHILNAKYEDLGATAFDETDGDITSSIYIDNQVNENLVGWYVVNYNVVDKAGNEAVPATRWVHVYNTAWAIPGYYNVDEQKLLPITETYQYTVFIHTDTLVNQRVLIPSLAGNSGQTVYADISDSTLVIPFQRIKYDSLNSYTIQGSGKVNDSIIKIEYTKIDSVTSFWISELKR